jgi:tetratricopeptide (TPR) repeat protein
MNTEGVGAALFAYTGARTAQMEGLAQTTLGRGIDLFVDGKYEEAIRAFRATVGLAPNSSLAIDALNQIAQAYTQLNDADEAISAYQQSIRLDPFRADSRIGLGNVYFFDGRHLEAQKEYEQAVRLDPSAVNRFSLGQAYMENGNYTEAELQFKHVRTLEPREPSGSYGLGQVYARQGRYDEAVASLQDAINVQRDFWDAYVEMGYAYADSGDLDKARELVSQLAGEDAERAATLSAYLYEKTTPKMVSISSDGSFPTALSRGTTLFALSAYLANAESSQAFSVIFNFNKEMDPASVENVLNWTIGRSVGTGLGDGYNFGLAVPDTEVTLPPHPIGVYYDRASYSATVWFEVRQNANADGTIDPSHIQFSFSGADRYGQTVSTEADQYTGFSGIA